MALVKIVHPELGLSSVSEVDESSLYQWHQSGWRRATEDDFRPAQPEEPARPAVPAAVKPAPAAPAAS